MKKYKSRQKLKSKQSNKVHIKKVNSKGVMLVTAFVVSCFALVAFLNRGYSPKSLGAVSTNYTVASAGSGDVANQDGSAVTVGSSNMWLGTGQSRDNSYLGLKLAGAVPNGTNISSARLIFTAPRDQWISLSFTVYAEKNPAPMPYTSSNPPSLRQKTTASKSFSDNVKWATNREYFYDVTDVVKEVVNSNSSPRSINLIIKGTGGSYARKFINANTSYPKLVLTYDDSTTPPVGTTQPPVGTTQPPVGTTQPPVGTTQPPVVKIPPVVTMVSPLNGSSGLEPATIIVNAQASAVAPATIARVEFYNGTTKIAEDTSSPYTYIWNDVMRGTYNISARAFDSNNLSATSSAVTTTVLAAATQPPVGTTQPPVGTTQPPVGGSTAPTVGTNSYAFGLWTPSTRDTCTKEDHDSYFVVGPDGKKYPTWHPPVHRRANGTTCTFGHEHGRDPKGYAFWSEIQKHFAFDADGNGQISSAELATAGIPFNYANEQMDTAGMAFMRHEDHVGNKIEYANGEADRGESNGDGFNSSATGGVVVPIKGTSTKWVDSGIKCYYFHKLHQGVSSPDALTNNIHEFVIHAKCTSTRSGYPSNTTLVTGLIPFGAPGEFTEFCNDDRDNIIRLGTTTTNAGFPGTRSNGFRNIISRACLERTFWVPQGQFSSFPYEDWDGDLRIVTSSGKLLVDQHGAWDVLDAIRYYDPNSANKISFMTDACYFTEANGDKARGGECDSMTNYGSLKLSYDDPRAFNGTHRGQYINPPTTVNNTGGPTIWYTDSFGNNAQTTPFKGSIKQYIDPVSASTANLNTDPRNIQRRHDDGGRTVHWPN